ncbi:hypothetical protein AC1031_010957 [Aphanomyces cochlioides]|nr:hypothetical protein AC1031_010957 [Aphanomyces cochlioides]
MHHSNDRIAREYAQTPRPPPFRLGMTRLAQHDDEVLNSWRDQDEFSAAEFIPVPPILPDPARRPDSAKVARLANQLKRGISDTLPFPDLVMVVLDLLFTFRSMVMSQVQWQDYREALLRRDEEASQGTWSDVDSNKSVAPYLRSSEPHDRRDRRRVCWCLGLETCLS